MDRASRPLWPRPYRLGGGAGNRVSDGPGKPTLPDGPDLGNPATEAHPSFMQGLDRLMFVMEGAQRLVVCASEVMDLESVSHLEGGAAIPPSAFRWQRLATRLCHGQGPLWVSAAPQAPFTALRQQSDLVEYLAGLRQQLPSLLRSSKQSVVTVRTRTREGPPAHQLPMMPAIKSNTLQGALEHVRALATGRRLSAANGQPGQRLVVMALVALAFADRGPRPLVPRADMPAWLTQELSPLHLPRGPHVVVTDNFGRDRDEILRVLCRGNLMLLASLDANGQVRLLTPLEPTGLGFGKRSLLAPVDLCWRSAPSLEPPRALSLKDWEARYPSQSTPSLLDDNHVPPERIILLVDSTDVSPSAFRDAFAVELRLLALEGRHVRVRVNTFIRPATVVCLSSGTLPVGMKELIEEISPSTLPCPHDPDVEMTGY